MKSIIRQIIASVLLGVFAIPVLVPALHELFEDHEHFICTAVDIDHLHEDIIECELCDYLIGIQPIANEAEEERPGALVQESFRTAVEAPTHSLHITTYYLRGPPSA